jgi:hypothetical protein
MFRIFFILFIASFFSSFSQIGPRTWEDHLSINSCNTVSKKGNTIYASYYNGLIKFDEEEKSPETWNKINGLSDIGIRLLRTNPYNNKLLVIYDNCNIDVIDANEELKNYPDIKLKSLNGKKIVNEVTFDKQFAYLACGFGIIVFDTEKMEIKDTYIIGANASNLEVNQLALTESEIFAATPIGMYKANRASALINFKNWSYDTLSLPPGYYGGVVNVQGKILNCLSLSTQNGSQGKDTVYQYINSTWVKYGPMANEKVTTGKLSATFENLFSYIDPTGLVVRDINTGATLHHFVDYNGQIDFGMLKDCTISKDYTGKISYWLANQRFGLNQSYIYYDAMKKVTRNGTNKAPVGNIDIFEGKVAVSPSYIDPAGIGNYTQEGLNLFKDKEWSYFPCYEAGTTKPVLDVTSVLFDRIDRAVVWACSWYYGLMKYKDNKLVAVYTPSNTAMPTYFGQVRCSGLSSDKAGNIWFANSNVSNFLSVIKKDGTYLNFQFASGTPFTRKTYVDKNNLVWILHERTGGLSVYKNTNFSTPKVDVNYKFLNNNSGSGNLESNDVYSIAEDKDGKIWIGTGEGISVIYNPSALFNGGDYDAQPIKIVQDGNVELLLGKEAVTAIAVDGANNKWCGTSLGGVYCFSPDGLTQLYHFTKENSSLYSNAIVDLNYDETSGDVFIATEAGLQSFRGIVVEGEQDYSNVFAYPNPVRPGYQGKVLIRGLVDESIVKIADESGNLVWETKSTGGQIEWPITTLSNVRVSSGVYLIYASTTTGELKTVAKILVVN